MMGRYDHDPFLSPSGASARTSVQMTDQQTAVMEAFRLQQALVLEVAEYIRRPTLPEMIAWMQRRDLRTDGSEEVVRDRAFRYVIVYLLGPDVVPWDDCEEMESQRKRLAEIKAILAQRNPLANLTRRFETVRENLESILTPSRNLGRRHSGVPTQSPSQRSPNYQSCQPSSSPGGWEQCPQPAGEHLSANPRAEMTAWEALHTSTDEIGRRPEPKYAPSMSSSVTANYISSGVSSTTSTQRMEFQRKLFEESSILLEKQLSLADTNTIQLEDPGPRAGEINRGPESQHNSQSGRHVTANFKKSSSRTKSASQLVERRQDEENAVVRKRSTPYGYATSRVLQPRSHPLHISRHEVKLRARDQADGDKMPSDPTYRQHLDSSSTFGARWVTPDTRSTAEAEFGIRKTDDTTMIVSQPPVSIATAIVPEKTALRCGAIQTWSTHSEKGTMEHETSASTGTDLILPKEITAAENNPAASPEASPRQSNINRGIGEPVAEELISSKIVEKFPVTKKTAAEVSGRCKSMTSIDTTVTAPIFSVMRENHVDSVCQQGDNDEVMRISHAVHPDPEKKDHSATQALHSRTIIPTSEDSRSNNLKDSPLIVSREISPPSTELIDNWRVKRPSSATRAFAPARYVINMQDKKNPSKTIRRLIASSRGDDINGTTRKETADKCTNRAVNSGESSSSPNEACTGKCSEDLSGSGESSNIWSDDPSEEFHRRNAELFRHRNTTCTEWPSERSNDASRIKASCITTRVAALQRDIWDIVSRLGETKCTKKSAVLAPTDAARGRSESSSPFRRDRTPLHNTIGDKSEFTVAFYQQVPTADNPEKEQNLVATTLEVSEERCPPLSPELRILRDFLTRRSEKREITGPASWSRTDHCSTIPEARQDGHQAKQRVELESLVNSPPKGGSGGRRTGHATVHVPKAKEVNLFPDTEVSRHDVSGDNTPKKTNQSRTRTDASVTDSGDPEWRIVVRRKKRRKRRPRGFTGRPIETLKSQATDCPTWHHRYSLNLDTHINWQDQQLTEQLNKIRDMMEPLDIESHYQSGSQRHRSGGSWGREQRRAGRQSSEEWRKNRENRSITTSTLRCYSELHQLQPGMLLHQQVRSFALDVSLKANIRRDLQASQK